MKPKVSVYIATSLDGFIARKDGGIDWLDFDSGSDSGDLASDTGSDSGGPEFDPDEEDYGFAEFFASVDVLLMGRHTFEKLLTFEFDQWIYGDTPLKVLSNTMGPEAIPAHLEHLVSITSGKPEEILDRLAEAGFEHAYVDGGITVQAFIAAGLVDEINITIIPVLIGDGIPLFGPLNGDVSLRHVATKSLPFGLVQLKYSVSE